MNVALSNLVTLSDRAGHAFVAPSFHASNARLSDDSRQSAEVFAARMLNHPRHDTINALGLPQNGSTTKVHFRVGGQLDADGLPRPSSVYMIKPYYESLSDWNWGDLPVSGWAEMAYHGILHKAGLGHMAMKVHAFPYGGTNLLGVELEPDLHPVGVNLPPEFSQIPWNASTQMGRTAFSSGAKDDAAKLGALDFLLNHQDRSVYNLLMKVGNDGEAHSLLAIDNGLSMQYAQSARWAKYQNRDNLFHYLKAPAFRSILKNDWSGPLKAISGWWKQYKPEVVKEFMHQASGIHSPPFASHVVSSFKDRVTALDNAVEDFDRYGHQPYDEHLRGYVTDVNKPIYNRAGVAMRPNPFPGATAPMAYHDSCPSCGESMSV